MALLGGDNGTTAAVIAWIGAIRVPLKLVSGWLQDLMTKALARVADTEDVEDDKLVAAVLRSKLYRLIAFVVDLAFSFKLPLKLKS